MTSDEIKRQCDQSMKFAAQGTSDALRDAPLWEIAYQLAVFNERNDVPKSKHNPFGEVSARAERATSGDEVRGDIALGYWWVWYESEWHVAKWDGEDWDILAWGATVPKLNVLIGPHIPSAPAGAHFAAKTGAVQP